MVTAGPGNSCTEGDVRLVGGGNEFMERVEVCFGGEWGTVCGDPTFWGSTNALIVCRQLFCSSSGEFCYNTVAKGDNKCVFYFSTVQWDNKLKCLSCCRKSWQESPDPVPS